jgi:hypothetical protein
MTKYIGLTLRALYAAAVTFVNGLGAALLSDQSVSDLDAKTWLYVIGLTLAAFGGVYGIRNRPID